MVAGIHPGMKALVKRGPCWKGVPSLIPIDIASHLWLSHVPPCGLNVRQRALVVQSDVLNYWSANRT